MLRLGLVATSNRTCCHVLPRKPDGVQFLDPATFGRKTAVSVAFWNKAETNRLYNHRGVMNAMIQQYSRRLVFLILAIAGTVILSSSCTHSGGEGFAIYLTKEEIPPAEMEAQSHVELAEGPMIGIDDIVSYNMQTYELKVTQSAFECIFQLDVPTTGKTFLVCVDKSPVYWGAFWTPISSQSFNGVTIWKPYNASAPYIVTLELGYPSSSFYAGADPRNNPEIISALKKAGKLITALTLSNAKSLPGSMKGYELYSWKEDGSWHFTLITGTNRNKTLEEITSGECYISETGWVNIHCTGVEAIKTALGKAPPGEWISWRDGSFVSGDGILAFPPQNIIDDISNLAVERGLNFNS